MENKTIYELINHKTIVLEELTQVFFKRYENIFQKYENDEKHVSEFFSIIRKICEEYDTNLGYIMLDYGHYIDIFCLTIIVTNIDKQKICQGIVIFIIKIALELDIDTIPLLDIIKAKLNVNINMYNFLDLKKIRNAKTFNYLYNNIDYFRVFVNKKKGRIINYAANNGFLDLIQLLLRMFNERKYQLMTLRCAASHRYVNILQWLVHECKINDKDIIDNKIFTFALQNDHYDVLQWIITTFVSIKEDLEDSTSDLFRISEELRNLNVFQWLINRSISIDNGLKQADIEELYNFIRHDDLDKIKQMINVFKITSEDILNTNVLCHLAKNGYTTIFKYLVEYYDLALADITQPNNNVIHSAVLGNNPKIISWLTKKFTLWLPVHLDASDTAIIQKTIEDNNVRMLYCLTKYYEIPFKSVEHFYKKF